MFLVDAQIYFSVGGALVALTAGTSLVDKPRSWWRTAAALAVLGAAVDIGGRLIAWPDLSAPLTLLDWAIRFLVFVTATMIVAAIGRLLARFGAWPPLRILFCMATDVFLRAAPLWFILGLACGVGRDCP